MSDKRVFSGLPAMLLALVLNLFLAGCGGGGGGGAAGTLGGTAATGAPVDGILYVTDSNGIEVNVPIEADGSFSISVEGMTPPYLLRVIPNAGGDVLYSFAAENNITVNVTPLTTLALYLAYSGDLDALYATWSANTAMLDDVLVEAQQEVINANLSTLLDGYAVDASFYDFFSEAFATDSTGIDGALDALNISIDYQAGNFTVLIDGTPYTWDPDIDTSAINIGDFGVEEGSVWLLTVTDSINNIEFSERVLWSTIPNDLDQFADLGETEIMADFVVEGLAISVNITGLDFDVVGSGGFGTLVSGQITGTVGINGVIDGQVINETVNLNTLFQWERVDNPVT